jgi:cytosine/uracil/thiamine/allantoin permease
MDLITIIIVLCVAGLLIWAVNAYLPIAQPIKGVVILMIVLVLCIWLLNAAGLGDGLSLHR